MRSAAIAAVGVLFLAAGCGEQQSSEPGTPTAEATEGELIGPCPSSAHALTLDPSTAAPGELFTVKYPSRKVRTENVFMYRVISDSTCRLDYELSHNGSKYTWYSIEGTEFSSLGNLWKRSSHRAVVPEVAEPGKYQICDDDSRACAVLTVQD